MNVNCRDIRSQLAQASDSMTRLGQAATQAAVVAQDLDISMRLLACRSNRQKRKIRNGLLQEARAIVSSFDTFGGRQDSAFDQARQQVVKLREKADWIVTLWKCN